MYLGLFSWYLVSYTSAMQWAAPRTATALHQFWGAFCRTCSVLRIVYILHRDKLQWDAWSQTWDVVQVCTCEKPTRDRHLRPIRVPEEAPQEVVDLIRECHEPDWQRRPNAATLHTKLEACPWERIGQWRGCQPNICGSESKGPTALALQKMHDLAQDFFAQAGPNIFLLDIGALHRFP